MNIIRSWQSNRVVSDIWLWSLCRLHPQSLKLHVDGSSEHYTPPSLYCELYGRDYNILATPTRPGSVCGLIPPPLKNTITRSHKNVI